MGINKAVRNLVFSNMFLEERARFSFVENQVSVLDLLKIQRNRNIDSKNHLYCCLGDESQYIDLAYFKKYWRGSDGDSSICMNFFLTKIGNIVCEKPIGVSIEYRDGELFLLHEEMLKLELLKGKKEAEEVEKVEKEIRLFKDTMLDKNRNSLIEVAHYGTQNHYNQEPRLSTISQEFGVNLGNNDFTLSISSEILAKANKEFYLTYYYDSDSSTNISRLAYHCIEGSKMGPWKLQTNIPFMKGLIKKPLIDDYKRNVGNGIDVLCQNLKIDYELLPGYLQIEVDKVKSLRK